MIPLNPVAQTQLRGAGYGEARFFFALLLGVFFLMRAFWLPGPLWHLAFPPNTVSWKGAYLEQVVHWNEQIDEFGTNSAEEVALYEQDPSQVSDIFRHFYGSSLSNYRNALILMGASAGLGIGIILRAVWRRKKTLAEQARPETPGD